MSSFVSMIQDFKEFRRSQDRRRRSPSPPPEPEYIPYSPIDNRAPFRSSRAPKKAVRWGSVTQIPSLPQAGRYYTHTPSRVSGRRPVKSILKPPTTLDQEMFRHNMWRMVGMADERLDFTYQCIGDMRGMGYQALDLIMNWEERSIRNELTRKVLESTHQLDNMSLETTSSRSRRLRRLRRRRSTRF